MVSKPPYDQMAPQLCQFYVPGQPSNKKHSTKDMVWLLQKHRPDKRKIQIVRIYIRFLIQTGSIGIFLLSGRWPCIYRSKHRYKRPAPIWVPKWCPRGNKHRFKNKAEKHDGKTLKMIPTMEPAWTPHGGGPFVPVFGAVDTRPPSG